MLRVVMDGRNALVLGETEGRTKAYLDVSETMPQLAARRISCRPAGSHAGQVGEVLRQNYG